MKPLRYGPNAMLVCPVQSLSVRQWLSHFGPGVLELQDLSHDEIWDDSMLIQQYDQAMAQVKKKLEKKIQGSKTSEGDSEVPDASTTKENTTKRDRSNTQKKKKKSKKKREWYTGDPCRAKFTEDGMVYEATVVSMQPDHGTCRVRYVGYENEEDLPVRTLIKSKGEEARRRQFQESNNCMSVESDLGEGNSSVVDSDVTSDVENDRIFTSKAARMSRPHPEPKKSKISPPFCKPSLPQMPPPPAMLSGEKDAKTTEALHTMLMSWYMTGYHTGYYQALNEANSRKHTTF
ncbi:survival motor neuron isoform X2 [Oratosquilla oratoria]|uniref:survival motor neuron isoform X2 n=1 Tax=Oratosquilla oratoria TaxID=337810 RepID=UPI003F774A3D